MAKLAEDDQAADHEFNPMSGFNTTGRTHVDGRLWRIQDRVQELGDRTTAQGGDNDGARWVAWWRSASKSWNDIYAGS